MATSGKKVSRTRSFQPQPRQYNQSDGKKVSRSRSLPRSSFKISPSHGGPEQHFSRSAGGSREHIRTGSTASTTSLLFRNNHSQILQYLTSLNSQEILNVGLRLGLRYNTLQRMNQDSLLNDMVYDWLRRDDDVIKGSGAPSWESLIKALEECGHTGIATDIKEQEDVPLMMPACLNEEQECSFQDVEDVDADEDSLAEAYLPNDMNVHYKERRLDCNGKHDSVISDAGYKQNMSNSLLSVLPADALPEDEMIGRHKCYHRSISGTEAERRLRAHSDHCYLTRYSEKRGCYILTVYQKNPISITKHFRIEVQGNRPKIQNKTKDFATIEDLLAEYERNPIDPSFQTIGRPITEDEYLSIMSKSKSHKCCTLS